MRNSQYYSQFKESLLERLKPSSDTAESNEQQLQRKKHFYKMIEDEGRLISCRILNVQTIPRWYFQRSYALYEIEVLTDDLHYSIKKRYSQFQQFYRQVEYQTKLNTQFPPKTILQSGSALEVTEKRLVQLNQLIDEIMRQSLTSHVKYLFYDFLRIYDNYHEKGIIVDKCSEKQIPLTDQFLLLSLKKLNQKVHNSLQIFNEIKMSILDRKRRISYEIIKQLFAGYEDKKGLLIFTLRSQNQLIIIEGLKLINILCSPETNRQYEFYIRVLQKHMPFHLLISMEQYLIHNLQMKKLYFSLLKCYLVIKSDISIQDICKHYNESKLVIAEYKKWEKYNSLDQI